MDALTPLVDAVRQLVLGVPEQALPLGGEMGSVAAQVPLPDGIVGAAYGLAVAFLQRTQAGLRGGAPGRLVAQAGGGRNQRRSVAGQRGGDALNRILLGARWPPRAGKLRNVKASRNLT